MYRPVSLYLLGGLFLMIFPVIATAASLELAGSKDKPFCERVLELFQKNLGSGSRLGFDAEPFSQIKWEPVSLAGIAPKVWRCSSLDKALIDLDNGGTKDLVIKTTFCMKGAPSDSFYVFPSDSKVLEQASWQNMSPLLATTDKFERTGGTYPLTALPAVGPEKSTPVLSIVFALQPFILDEKVYVALTDGRGEWIVVAKYLRGERFEDQCYFRASSN